MFTDHRNLLFTFHSTAVESSFGRHNVLKVIRWTLYLSAFSNTTEHMQGEINNNADIMAIWMRKYRLTDHAAGCISRLRIQTGREKVPTAPPDLADWASCDNLRTTQTSALQMPSDLTDDDDGLLRTQSKIWIPEDADVLKLKLLTFAHARQAGHRGSDATFASLQ